MAKREARGGAGGLDIFDDESVLGAFADATASAVAPELPAEPAKPSGENVVEMPQQEAALVEPTPSQDDQFVGTAPRKRRQKAPDPPRPAPASEPEPVFLEPNVGLKFRVPRSIKDDFSRFKADLGAALGVHLEDSNIGRAIIERFLVDGAEQILIAAKDKYGELKRPRNNDAVAMAEFDETLGGLFVDARKRRKVTRRDGN